MAVVAVSQWQANPGRLADLIAAARLAPPVHLRYGGRSRLLTATVAGPNTGILTFITEFDDMAAYAKWSDGIGADPEWQALAAKHITAADAPGKLISASLLRDLPI